MSIARHHNEWLSLIEISGPFLSLPVLMRTFPQGLEALDRDGLAELRLAYEKWLDDQNSLRPSPAIHSVWVRYVLEHVLGFGKSHLLEGPAIPATLQAFVAEQGETLRPDLAIVSNDPSAQKPRMLVQVCPITQGLEKSMQNHRWKASPAMRMLELLRATGVSLGLVTNGEQWMLVNAPKGETSAFVSWYAALWLEEPLTLRAFSSLLGATRFFSVADEDTLEGMLKDSVNEQQEVTDQLGYQVRRAVEVLIRAIDKADQDCGRTLLKDIPEKDLYEAALTVMMRLVFLFSAEERGLLLLGDPLYDQNYAVSTLRAQLRETADQLGEEVLERRFDAWCRLLATFRAVHDGIHHDRLNLPAYGGSLFDPERYPFLEGRTTQTSRENVVLPISNRTVLHLLEALQVLRVKVPGGGPAEARRLSFRALDVEQIGHVYEGLLDHIAVRAGEPVLGLAGTREKEPELLLPTLRAEEVKGEKSFLAFLKEQTGRSENALRKALQERPDVFTNQHLLIACNNDAKMLERVAPYVGLLREDDFGYPAVFLPGSVYVTAGATRRATGTHYTPRSLTEPIVLHTLEPLVYTGPAEGLPKEEWKLKSPAELLELKVCDMAMGSAGFLVQVIRYLSERLVEAWDVLNPEGSNPGLRITPEGQPASGKPGELIIPTADEERLVLARRLVADRCIYGVDKNPLAVEIAKLSIWLTTMDKGRPFTFLDHALKCGDSLVGADEDMYRKWAYSLKGAQFTLYLTTLEEFTAAARQKRKELESFTVLDVRDAEHKAELLKEADAAMARVKLGCDLLVGVHLLGLKPAEQETMLSHLLWDYVAGLPMDSPDAHRALHAARKESAFHWPFEFPEVFKKGGFNAFVGNPPFLGGWQIPTYLGAEYSISLKLFFQGTPGTADLAAYFYRRCYELLIKGGYFGLIATKSIAESDTRSFGLESIIIDGGIIYRADISQPWPGQASVIITILHINKKSWSGIIYRDGINVKNITSSLNEDLDFELAKRLSHNITYSQGTMLYGGAFVKNKKDISSLLVNNPGLLPYIRIFVNGDILNGTPNVEGDLVIIDFGDRNRNEILGCDNLLTHLSVEVAKERENQTRQIHETRPWLHWDKRLEFYSIARKLERILALTIVSTNLAFIFSDPNKLYSHGIKLFADSRYGLFALLQSTIHDVWSRATSSTLGNSIRYSTSTTFDKFPLENEYVSQLESIGMEYHNFRGSLMVSRQEGLTPIYNRFHNPKEKSTDIARLRELHIEMDNAVAAAYGWSDLELGHGFHETPQGVRFTISEAARREVLARLLRLNHERYEEEVRQGLHEKDKKKAKEEQPARQKPKKLAQPEGQMNLLAEPEVSDVGGAAEVLSPTSMAEIGSWDRCKCLACGKTVMGFSIAEHTQSEHQGKDPGYRKMG